MKTERARKTVIRQPHKLENGVRLSGPQPKSEPTDEQLVYPSVDALARELNINRQSVYAGLRSGVIPGIRLGKRWILPRAAIRAWLANAGGSL